MTQSALDEIPPAPSYKLLKTPIDEARENGDFRKMYHVKLGLSGHIGRKYGTANYVEVDHVIVGVSRLTKSDENGTFVYEETTVLASDPEMTEHKVFLYVGLRALSLEEAMFNIGEV